MTIRAYGDRAILVDTHDPVGLGEAARGLPYVVDVVPGARALLVVCASADGIEPLREQVARLRPVPATTAADEVVLDVVYDGADLDEVTATTGLTTAGVRRAHSTATYDVALVGFAPGFAYLRGLDPALAMPRLPEPRPLVPAGAVAIAGEWSGVYPGGTPGGWRLLGHTDAVLWSLDRDPPALLRPGTRVRFRDVT